MAAFKNKTNGTWYVQFRYTDWKGERQQKLKRGFATKKEAQAWEREFLMQKQADVNMTFESFAQLYEKDMKPKLKLNTWLTKESIIQISGGQGQRNRYAGQHEQKVGVPALSRRGHRGAITNSKWLSPIFSAP